MTLEEKLERAAKKYDDRVRRSLSGVYDQTGADMRDILEAAARRIVDLKYKLFVQR